jgi:hypothetical protein
MVTEVNPLGTGFPFNHSRRDYQLMLERIPTRDLLAEVEAASWLALDVASLPGDSRAVAELQLSELVEELERRQRLLKARSSDPLRPAWPRPEHDLKGRIEAVKRRWPIATFCTEMLGCDLEPAGPGRWKARCPLAGHDDRTPSFVAYEATDSAWCFGCSRGGDAIALAGYAMGYERFHDSLEHLEQIGGGR